MPDSVAFTDAIQTPGLFHPSVGKVSNGKLKMSPLGIPMPISGNFAVVFQTQVGKHRYALRCFSKPAGDQAERFEKISLHLAPHASKYFVHFKYHPEGLRVGKQWQPLMVMEWSKGASLEAHIESLLGDSEGLLGLAGQWVDLFEHLREIDLAHGDIHPDNVIVTDGELKLIDYDAIYVPALQGRKIQEVGQQNFQHPGRTGDHYGPYMDHFPSWIVYYTIILLCVQPELWNEFDGGDQKLLFSKADYAQPDQSLLIAALERSEIAIFPLIARNIRSLLAKTVETVPALSHNIIQAGGLPLPPQPPLWWIKPTVASDWWKDHVSDAAPHTPKSWTRKR